MVMGGATRRIRKYELATTIAFTRENHAIPGKGSRVSRRGCRDHLCKGDQHDDDAGQDNPETELWVPHGVTDNQRHDSKKSDRNTKLLNVIHSFAFNDESAVRGPATEQITAKAVAFMRFATLTRPPPRRLQRSSVHHARLYYPFNLSDNVAAVLRSELRLSNSELWR